MKLDKKVLVEMKRQHDIRQSLRFTFKSGSEGIEALSAFSRLDGVHFDSGQALLIFAIFKSREWGFDRNRTVDVRLDPSFDWISGRFAWLVEAGVESIRVLSESPLNELLSSRQKRREEAKRSIAAAVLPDSLRREIEGWGHRVDVTFETESVLPEINVTIRNSDDAAVIDVALCGWSGVIKVNGRHVAFCESLPTAEVEIRKALDKYLESATT